MALKTFNIDEIVYKNYSKHCKNRGISMSKQIENFLKEEVGKITSLPNNKNKKFQKIEKISKNSCGLIEHHLKKYC